jgi:hypothetical protein
VVDVVEAEIALSQAQYKFLTSISNETVFCSGVGGGKTFALANKLIECSQIAGSFGLLSAPTHDQVKTATWKGIEEAFAELGIQDGIHYVVGVRPPDEWQVKPFTKLSNARIITWATGSYTLISGLDRFNNIRGSQLDYALIDEFRDLKFSQVRKVIQGRMRGKAFKEINRPHQIFWVSTPPDDVRELKEVLKDETICYIQGTTFDNVDNLPKEYIDNLKKYDSVTFDREVLGMILDSVPENLFAYAYDSEFSFVDFKEYDYKFNALQPVNISFDFNVDPITCLIGQSYPNSIRIFKTFADANSNTQKLCDKVKAWLPNEPLTIQITGDANGFKRDTRSSLNDYQIIMREFDLSKYQILAPRKNPSVRDSRVLTNSILENFDIAFDKAGCSEIDSDLRHVTVNDNGDIDKKKHGAHSLDNLRYYLHTWHSDFLKRSYGSK